MDLGYSRLQSGLLLQMSEVCVCLFIGHNGEPYKTDEPIEMPFGLWTRVDSGVLLKWRWVYAKGRGKGTEGTLLIYDR